MRRMESIQRRFFSLCFVLIISVSTACAEGLFPSMDQMFGTAMPSIGVSLGQSANETGENADGKYEIYTAFTHDNYTAFGTYLNSVGAKLKDYQVTDSTITATISVRGASMQFTYDWLAQTASAIYPSGTRPETETETETLEAESSILPPVGGIMPSAQYAIGRKPNSESADENGITQIWTNFTDADYSSFSSYLAQTGATLLQNDVEAGILTATIGLYSNSFTLTYDWHTKELSLFYPNGASPEREKWNTLKGNGSILPKMEIIGKNLPSMSQALSRLPDTTETLADGSQKETYNGFNEADYTAFSQYLQTAGCTVDDYYVEDGNVMVIKLSNLSGNFIFTYDSLRHIGTVVYPKGSWVETAWVAPTPTPIPTATRKPNTSTPTANYSESQCYSAAAAYLKSVLKNPSSLQIHTYRTINYDETYCFVFDYSAQNSFGGYTRSDAYIWITKATGEVYWADFK